MIYLAVFLRKIGFLELSRKAFALWEKFYLMKINAYINSVEEL